jgi:hypothetical protein
VNKSAAHRTAVLIAERLRRAKLTWAHEYDVQDAVAQVLEGWGDLRICREVKLTRSDRVDFMVDGVVAVECKIKGSIGSVERQLERYAKCPEVGALVLVTARVFHASVGRHPCGKPLQVVWVGSL